MIQKETIEQSDFSEFYAKKTICISRDINILTQSNISINNQGKLAICEPDQCIILNLKIKQSNPIIIDLRKGDSYRWVYPWNSGFLICGDEHYQFINKNNQLQQFDLPQVRIIHFPNTQDIYYVQTDEFGETIKNLKNKQQIIYRLPTDSTLKIRSKVDFNQHVMQLQSAKDGYTILLNLKTKQQVQIKPPQNFLQFLILPEQKMISFIYNTAKDDTIELTSSKNKTVQKLFEIGSFSKPQSFHFSGVDSKNSLVAIRNGVKIELINYKTNKKKKLSQLLLPQSQNIQYVCQVMSGNFKYYCMFIKPTDGTTKIQCYDRISINHAKIFVFENSKLFRLYGQAIIRTMMLKL